ncbi:MAG: hypothetical protein WBV94_31800, partial [Blastocatellia bacterium]
MTKHLTNDTAAQQRPTFFEPPPDLAPLARLQGTAPVVFDELMATPEHWPDDESVDDFIAAVREWCSEGIE